MHSRSKLWILLFSFYWRPMLWKKLSIGVPQWLWTGCAVVHNNMPKCECVILSQFIDYRLYNMFECGVWLVWVTKLTKLLTPFIGRLLQWFLAGRFYQFFATMPLVSALSESEIFSNRKGFANLSTIFKLGLLPFSGILSLVHSCSTDIEIEINCLFLALSKNQEWQRTWNSNQW